LFTDLDELVGMNNMGDMLPINDMMVDVWICGVEEYKKFDREKEKSGRVFSSYPVSPLAPKCLQVLIRKGSMT